VVYLFTQNCRKKGLISVVRLKCHVKGVAMQLIKRLLADETGGEVLEYALIAGLIVVAAIAVIGAVGDKVLARWSSLNNSI